MVESGGLAQPVVAIEVSIVPAIFMGSVQILWNSLIDIQRVDTEGEVIEISLLEVGVVAFIDNITFHTIPEPSVLGMLVMGGLAWAMCRIRGRRHV